MSTRKKNPLISTFDWTNDAAQRILRVPAGFMRNRTQERIKTLARERAAARRADLSAEALAKVEASGEGGASIDLALVEEGIEIGKQEMAAMIANYPTPGTVAALIPEAPSAAAQGTVVAAPAAPKLVPVGNGSGYLNEVSPLTVHTASADLREH